MKLPSKSLALLTGAVFFSASSLIVGTASAESVSTDPVGYVTYEVNVDSDLLVGVPLNQAPVFTGSVLSVADGTIEFGSTVPDLSSSPHFALVVTEDSPLQGQWFTIIQGNSSSIIVEDDLSAVGLSSADKIKILPFWTLASLLPEGGGLPQSSNVFAPTGTVILNDVTAVGINPGIAGAYLYHDGSAGPAGWYDVNNLGGGVVGASTVLSPETYLTFRNRSEQLASVVFSGSVPTTKIANNIVSRSGGRQDNQISNPFPHGFSLSNSNLVESGAFSASSNVIEPTDRLLVYSNTSSSIRPGPIKTFIFHDGSVGPEGWYDVNNLGAGVQNTYVIPAGAALVVRKAGGSDVSIAWSPSVPYSL